jgi:hypothetical protein
MQSSAGSYPSLHQSQPSIVTWGSKLVSEDHGCLIHTRLLRHTSQLLLSTYHNLSLLYTIMQKSRWAPKSDEAEAPKPAQSTEAAAEQTSAPSEPQPSIAPAPVQASYTAPVCIQHSYLCLYRPCYMPLLSIPTMYDCPTNMHIACQHVLRACLR